MNRQQRTLENGILNIAKRSTWWFVYAVVLIIMGSAYEFPGNVRPDPSQPVQFLSMDWWMHPMERNAFRRLPAIISAKLSSIFLLPRGEKAWAVGIWGTILHTADGGKKWEPQTSGVATNLNSVHFSQNGLTGWAVGNGGAIVHTADGGRNWTEQASRAIKWLYSVHFSSDGLNGWVVGNDGAILHTGDGGEIWVSQASGTKEQLNSVHFSQYGLNGWVVGDGGTIVHTTDGGKKWEPQTSGATTNLNYVHFTQDGLNGWVVGDAETILHTTDGGKKWGPQTSGATTNLNSVHFTQDGLNGWMVGDAETILHTKDGGKKWKDAIIYRRYPAPIFYLLFLCAVAMVGYATTLAKKEKEEEQKAARQNIADSMDTDEPIDSIAHDRLNFGQTARGIAQFIKNENTSPPLTIAVTGEWGTGKSSLMKLVKENLRNVSPAFYPVWFNAWHHQKEEHLLASLLEAIRRQALPSWWHKENWHFRLRLLYIRSRKNFIWPVLVVIAFACLIKAEVWSLADMSDKRAIELLKKITISKAGAFASTIASMIIIAMSFAKGLTAFGLRPSVLFRELKAGIKVRDFSGRAGFRHTFMREFEEVTEALAPLRMVIFYRRS